MRNLFSFVLIIAFFSACSQRTTYSQKSKEKFRNGEHVYLLTQKDKVVAELWPVHDINLVTRTTDNIYFSDTTSLENIQKGLACVASTPDGMTTASFGAYTLQGKALANGKPCGDGKIWDYGIVYVKEHKIVFTHKREHEDDFEELYEEVKEAKGDLFFLPVVYRKGKTVSSDKKLDKVLVRRITPDGKKFGVVVFRKMVTYDEATDIILGLDEEDVTETTHIYFLDGGNIYGQCIKEVNGKAEVLGERNSGKVTAYIAYY